MTSPITHRCGFANLNDGRVTPYRGFRRWITGQISGGSKEEEPDRQANSLDPPLTSRLNYYNFGYSCLRDYYIKWPQKKLTIQSYKKGVLIKFDTSDLNSLLEDLRHKCIQINYRFHKFQYFWKYLFLHKPICII